GGLLEALRWKDDPEPSGGRRHAHDLAVARRVWAIENERGDSGARGERRDVHRDGLLHLVQRAADLVEARPFAQLPGLELAHLTTPSGRGRGGCAGRVEWAPPSSSAGSSA